MRLINVQLYIFPFLLASLFSALRAVTVMGHFCSNYIPPFFPFLCAVDNDIDAELQCHLNLIGLAHGTTPP